ncbi:sensor histidine kinase [Vagococcus xieshaowenii]|uniref:Sensor histidine kinase n=1 Tax=Vagococcus xieshaowenii TaxID=2562451 RepID=A0AAJ5EGI6_9ENTE|nr:sensor histidine kinase [Vagococcus xieshaowenii]QCA28366.1 sensor histidine kinase [Vagococcus xieshaowenii]TFZ42877.1 sensor histidine kinase [Vagococcus xieshaowenii]
MKNKTNYLFLFIYVFLFTLIILLFTSFIVLTAMGRKLWIKALFDLTVSVFPVFFFLMLMSLLIALVVTIVSYFIQRNQYLEIEEKIEQLQRGNYDHQVFAPQASSDFFEDELDLHIESLRKQLSEMSKELQVLSARPYLVDGESKEEILREERHRLARELHDSVSQQLFAASMMLSALLEYSKKQNGDEKILKQLDTIEDIINASQSEMRALLLHLRPINLEGKSLQKGIEQLLKELQTKINIEMVWDIQDIALPTTIEDNLFRIIQELFSNTLRHAKAKRLEVYMRKQEEMLSLRVIDDGVGFDTSQSKVGSYGLSNIKERVNQMGGTCKIISFKNKGTSIDIRVPLVGESDKDD